MTVDLTELAEAVAEVARLAGVDLGLRDISTELLPAPHRKPSSLRLGTQAVYVFLLSESCLKVGKAGSKTVARFTSQHYGSHAPSTLAKSILHDRSRVAALLPSGRLAEVQRLDLDSIGAWIEANTSRLHLFVPASAGHLGLNLVEAFVQCRFRPLFEGRPG